MDILTLTGLIVAFGGIVGGMLIEGGHISSLINGPAFLIVVGGTIGAVLVQTPMVVFKRALARSKWAFLPPTVAMESAIEKIVEWSNIARKEGLLRLEDHIQQEPDPFASKALQLLVDGKEPEEIRHILELDMSIREEDDLQAVGFFEGVGGYAPTIGIIGAVLGLIHVMGNLADPSKLGGGIAAAFVATIYGLLLANVFALPMGNKIKSSIKKQTRLCELIIEGVIAIAHGENPRNIESRLQGFTQK
ncbi:MAG: flagellar motor protein [Candidatus Competibacter denitrificans]|jgi:chemotaxis protein MotA|uniref:Flagellar motor protein MotA n=1 Tax=Candidatus Competibacter denitrificans Run_A_D11 TaxID=1400863 RepID=W6M4C2_9GAMM|nr:flagellar motor protein [Candidatus Competibacter denitrificans]CDI02537.1 Flagellar motor protein MotA [Candidatus Competibacter denitrificans Run_A_D11]HRC69526.1 flagellar motor protein [Candidatus Competibacter denitrificans]